MNKHTPLHRAQAIADLVMAFGQVRRATLHLDGEPESDTTHTVMLALLAADLAPEVGLDSATVALFALVHDLVERYTGDVNTARALSPEAALAKAEREAWAIGRLDHDTSGSPWIAGLIRRYEIQKEPEARFVRYLDKVMPKLTHRRNGCRAVTAIGMDLAEMRQRHAIQGAELQDRYPEWPLISELFQAACQAAEDGFMSMEAP